MFASLVYSLLRLLLDVVGTTQRDQAKLQAEVLVLRRQVQVLERQVRRVRWTPGDRMVLAALQQRLPRSAWAALLVQPETVLGWHRELVRRRWAAYRDRPRRGRPRLSEECRELIVRMARENSRWGYFRIRGELLKLGYSVSATSIRSVLRRASSTRWPQISADLEAVLGSSRRHSGCHRLLQCRHRLPEAALRSGLRPPEHPSCPRRRLHGRAYR